MRAIAARTLKRGTGARGLRAVIEELMRDILFEIPSRTDVREVVITTESVEERFRRCWSSTRKWRRKRLSLTRHHPGGAEGTLTLPTGRAICSVLP